MKFTNSDRRVVVEEFTRLGLNQEAFCAHLLKEYGIRISSRSLRTWLRRFGPKKDFRAECQAIVDAATRKMMKWMKLLNVPIEPFCPEEGTPTINPPAVSVTTIEAGVEATTSIDDASSGSVASDEPRSEATNSGTPSNVETLSAVVGDQGDVQPASISTPDEVHSAKRKGRICWDWA